MHNYAGGVFEPLRIWRNAMTRVMSLTTISPDILLHSILPHLAIPDLWSLIQAFPELEPIIDTYKHWGQYYSRTKDVPERFMTFREFFPKFQGIYIWGFVQKDTSMATWIASRPNSVLAEDRGPVVFTMKDRRGIFRNQYGFDLLKPLRLDFDIDFYVEQIGLGCYLIRNGYLFVRVPGAGIEPLPRLTNCKLGSLRQTQWGVQVEREDGTHWMILPVVDTLDKRVNVFKFPFPNKPHCCCFSTDGLWTVVDGMGVIEFSCNYDGGDDYKLLYSDFPEDFQCMYSFYRRVVADSGVNEVEEVVPEYRYCAILLGKSGDLYFLGPSRYFDHENGRTVNPTEWEHARSSRPEMRNWDKNLEFHKLKTKPGPQLSEVPKLAQFIVWGYHYGIGVDERDASFLYFDTNDQTNGPFLASTTVSAMGVYGIGVDGFVYRLDFLTAEWSRIPGITRAKKLLSTLIRCRDQIVELSAIQILTHGGELFQMGYTQGATVLDQGQTREVPVPAQQRLDPSRVGHYITAPGVSPRRRVFTNPFNDIPRKLKLPGFVEDIGVVYSESLLYVALLKEWQLV